jgi:hypothetical protein
MTIFHKSILAGAAEIARVEKNIEVYRSVLLQRDGTVVSANEQTRFIAQRSPDSMYEALPFGKRDSLDADAAVSHEQIVNLVKMVPVDKQFKGALEHVDISTEEGNVLDVSFNDGRGLVHFKIRSGRIPPVLAGWRNELKTFGVGAVGQKEMVFNRSRLKSVFNALDLACKYDGEFSFIVQRSFKVGYMWRCVNELTAQTILIFFTTPAPGTEMKFSTWEQSLFVKQLVRKL